MILAFSPLIRAVILKEGREVVRDGRLRVLGAIVIILAITALAFGVQQTYRADHARQHAAEARRCARPRAPRRSLCPQRLPRVPQQRCYQLAEVQAREIAEKRAAKAHVPLASINRGDFGEGVRWPRRKF